MYSSNAIRMTNFDSVINAAYSDQGGMGVTFYDVDNTTVTFIYAMQVTVIFIPDKEMAIIRSGNNPIIIRSKIINCRKLN